MSDLISLIDEFEEKLKPQKNAGYGQRAIPCQLDGEISRLIKAFVSASDEEREFVSSIFNEDQSRVLIAFSKRMAALAVRERSRKILLEGLIALVLEGWVGDARENIIALSLLNHSAMKLNIDPKEVFLEASKFAKSDVAQELNDFLKRNEKDKSIEAMAYRETIAEDGFRYKYVW